MPYSKEKHDIETVLAVREYYTKRYKRKSKRRLTRLLVKNFEEKDFVKAPLTLRLYLWLYKLLRGTSRQIRKNVNNKTFSRSGGERRERDGRTTV